MRLISYDNRVNIPYELSFIECVRNRMSQEDKDYPYQIVARMTPACSFLLGRYTTIEHRDYVMKILNLAGMAEKPSFLFPNDETVKEDLGDDVDADN